MIQAHTPSILATLFLVSPALGTWGTYQGNIQHTGFVDTSFASSNFSARWQRTLPTGINPVTSGDGRVYVSSTGGFAAGSLAALDRNTGSTVWQQNYSGLFSINPPAYANGRVYMQTCNHASDTYLRCYDAATGVQSWVAPHAAQWERYYAPTIDQGTVYVNGGYYGGMYAFDANTGSQRWYTSLPQFDEWTPSLTDQYAFAYFSEGNGIPGSLKAISRGGGVAFSIEDPRSTWTGWSTSQAVVLGSRNDAIVINGGRLISFDISNRSIGWELTGGFVGQASAANGVLYALQGGTVSIRDETTGNPLWAWSPPSGSVLGSMVATNSHLFVSTADSTYAIDLQTRRQVWSYGLGGSLALDAADSTLYIAGASGALAAITVPAPCAALGLVPLLTLRRRR